MNRAALYALMAGGLVVAMAGGTGAVIKNTINETPAQATDTLARTIWGEARSETVAGMEAVANVVMNRVRLTEYKKGKFWWGRGVTGVCRAPLQFSCWNLNDPNRAKLLAVTSNDSKFRVCLDIAARAVSGALRDNTNGADHYHTRSISPAWSRGKRPVATIGSHIFFKLEA